MTFTNRQTSKQVGSTLLHYSKLLRIHGTACSPGRSWRKRTLVEQTSFFWYFFLTDIWHRESFMGFSTLFLTAWPCQILVSTIFWYHNVKRSVRWISARTSSNIYNSFCFYIVLKKINLWTNLRFVALWSWWNSLHLWGYFRKSTRQVGSSKSSEKKICFACFGSAIGGSESRVSEMNFGKINQRKSMWILSYCGQSSRFFHVIFEPLGDLQHIFSKWFIRFK